MKTLKIRYKISALAIAGALVFSQTSCEKIMNLDDPNAPTEINMETPKAGLLNFQTGEMARYTAILTQQMQNGASDNTFLNMYEDYIITNSDYKYIYENAYSKVLNPSSLIGSDEGALLSGLMYHYLDGLFTNANYLDESGSVSLDMELVKTQLDELIAGNGQYANAAGFVKAKILMEEGDYAAALPLAQAFTAADTYSYTVAGSFSSTNNWINYKASRGGYMQTDAYAKTLFTGNDTLRYRAYFGYTTQNMVDTLQVNSANDLGFANSLLTIDIIGYVEAKLMEAECLSRTSGDPTVALNEAVSLNYTNLGLSSPPVYAGATLDDVKSEKYKIMFGHPQIIIDFRRWNAADGSYIPGFVEKIPGQFPGKHTYIVQ